MIGYYFPLNVSYFGYKLPEVVSMLNTDRFIPNAKNLWSRLLGETGIIGTALFVSWLYLQWKSATELEKQGQDRFFKTMGLVGKLFVVSFVIEGFSMDTFGLPYYWVAFGLVVAAWRMFKNTQVIEIEKQTV
jgi:O-antigen ligase